MSRLPSLGPRGEGWVVAQAVLLLAVGSLGLVGPGWPGSIRAPLTATGVALGTIGLAVSSAAALHLGSSLTPLPKPRDDATMRDRGLYRIVRHPIYSGVLALGLGWSLARSPAALAVTALLAVLFDLKSRREEAWLADRYPGYDEYRRRVRWRFVPGIR